MKKDTFYFSHDFNARSDEKIRELILNHGYEGYGLFWAIIEDLYNNANLLKTNYKRIAFELHTTSEVIQSIIEDFELFLVKDGVFSSKSISNRLKERKEKSEKARDSANKRWGSDETRNKPENCMFYVIEIFDEFEKFIKVGITSESVARRFSGKLPNYEYKLLYQKDLDTKKACEIEREIIAKFNNYEPNRKFAGSLECINISDVEDLLNFAMRLTGFRNAIKERKGKEIKVNNIDKRINDFINDVNQFKNNYPKHIIDTFISWWTEPNKSKTKMKFELQSTFDIKRRLDTFLRNDKTTSNGTTQQKREKPTQYKK